MRTTKEIMEDFMRDLEENSLKNRVYTIYTSLEGKKKYESIIKEYYEKEINKGTNGRIS